MADVARLAGVSLGSVSRALRGSPGVAPELHRRVRDAVRRLGYVPLRRRRAEAASLRGRTVAVLLLGMQDSLVRLPVVAAALQGAEAALGEAGARCLLANLPRPGPLPSSLERARIDGFVLKSAQQGDVLGRMDAALAERIRAVPSVWVLGRPGGAPGDAVGPAEESVGRLAAGALVRRGHRRLAFLNPKPDHALFVRRQASFTAHARRAGASVVPVLGAAGRWTLPLGIVDGPRALGELLDRLLRMRRRPTGVFVPGDSIAAMLYRAMAERGLRPGRDLSVVSCNHETPLIAGLHPTPVTVDVHAERIGRRAVARLEERLRDPGAVYEEIGIEPDLVEGGSVATA